VAREVVERYGRDIGAHPVGTGPFMLGEYQRSTRTVLVRNPGYRAETYVASGTVPPQSQAVAAALKGQRLPRVARIEIGVIEEGQSQWLAFLQGGLDMIETFPQEFIDELLVDGKLKPALAAQGIRHQVNQRPNTWWTYFNMEDPVVGGYTPEKIALRRAISLGFDNATYIRVVLKGRAVPALGIIPPDVAGHVPKPTLDAQRYDPAAARALLDRFGYKDRDGDGMREAPDGTPLKIEFWSTPNSLARQADELWAKNMAAIGLKMEFKKDRLPELRKMARLGKIPMRADGWQADYPDGENFMQLLYGPNVGQENQARFKLPEFDRLYDEARRLPDGAPRNALFARMTESVLAYAPWRMFHHRIEDQALHARVKNQVPHPILSQGWRYVEVDPASAGK
jgi:ABC-type transport system substrate-binding protein